MEKIDKPRGLIRYTTENALAGLKTNILRPRLIGYGIVLALMSALFVVALFMRVPAELDVIRDRINLYRVASDGSIENSYRLEVINKTQQDRTFMLSFRGAEGLVWKGPQEVSVSAGGHITVGVTLGFNPNYHSVETDTVWFTLEDKDGQGIRRERESRFISGRP